MRTGVVDETGEGFDSSSFSDLDLVVYCTPLRTAMTLLGEHAPFLVSGPTVTDVASLKKPLLSAASDAGLGRAFVGSHPMAGGEESGFKASREGLFEGARVWMVPGEASDEAVNRVREVWTSLGARAATIAADDHDVLMTWVSHLPQLTSNALAAVFHDADLRPSDLGPGGRDMTRLAGSGPDMWADLLAHAPKELLQGLRQVQGRLAEMEAHLRAGRIGQVRQILAMTREWTGGESWK
jgi:prephenate dehydrogenase